jgi:hypothetical protein
VSNPEYWIELTTLLILKSTDYEKNDVLGSDDGHDYLRHS